MSHHAARYRQEFPQIQGPAFITDGGLETSLIFLDEWELPEFAAFVLLDSASGLAALAAYYRRYIDIAMKYRLGLVLESPTWRASSGWGERLNYSRQEIEDLNRRAIAHMQSLRSGAGHSQPIVISGCIGPQDDGYQPEQLMSIASAEAYHVHQAQALAVGGADMLCAVTMTYVEEAIGITQAAAKVFMPLAISFTVETDGRLPSGMTLEQAIRMVDRTTGNYPAYYMVNCAHPTHFMDVLDQPGDWKLRILGVRANASEMSHAELDRATTLDDGEPVVLARQFLDLHKALPALRIMGGCCGTDHRHIEAMAQHCT